MRVMCTLLYISRVVSKTLKFFWRREKKFNWLKKFKKNEVAFFPLFSLIKLLLLRHIRHALFKRSPKQEPNERTNGTLFFLSADCLYRFLPFVLLLIAFFGKGGQTSIEKKRTTDQKIKKNACWLQHVMNEKDSFFLNFCLSLWKFCSKPQAVKTKRTWTVGNGGIWSVFPHTLHAFALNIYS